MMIFVRLLLAAICLLPGDALAVQSQRSSPDDTSACINTSEAQTLAENFAWLVASWSLNITYSETLLNATYAEDVHDWSDSIRVLESRGCTNGPEPLDSTRAQFAADQLNLPPFEFNVIRVWHACDHVTLLWERPQPGGQRVRGLVVLETLWQDAGSRGSKGTRQVKTIYSEFNTASWFVNTGVLKPTNCTTTEVLS